MHYTEAKGILSSQNGMNIYRGCSHGCIYCDSRSTCYNFTHPFEDIEVKQNAPELLEQALKAKRKRCMIATGSMSDPYMHLEEKLCLMRKCLEVIDRYGFGVTLLTKSSRVLRDLDLLEEINQKAKAVVQMTMTTYNEDLCRWIEPNVCGTKERFDTLMQMKALKIPTMVWLTPILPYINDTVENIDGILSYCEEAQVKGIICFGIGVTLRDGDREYFYNALDKYFPGMKEQYIRAFGSSYNCPSPNERQLLQRVMDFCSTHHMLFGEEACFSYLRELPKQYTQTSLF